MADHHEHLVQIDLEAIRRRRGTRGEHAGEAKPPRLWRSMDEWAQSPEFLEHVYREFPVGASEWPELATDPVSRRNFVKLMGASLALAGVAGVGGCSREPEEKIVPWVNPPEQVVPGKALYFATAMPLGGFVKGLLVESHEGRPTKVEGNPNHPGSLGATDAYAQASVLTLYDPDRSQTVVQTGQISTWASLATALEQHLRRKQEAGRGNGKGVRILTESVTSPTLADQLNRLLKRFPEARWHQWEPVNRGNAIEGSKQAFGGRYVHAVYDFSKAKRVVSLDCDFLQFGPGNIAYARQFINGRRLRRRTEGAGEQQRPAGVTDEFVDASEGESLSERVNRLYVVESTPTITGMKADHRLALKPSRVEGFARALAAAVGVSGVEAAAAAGVEGQWLAALARDLRDHKGASLIVAGETQPPAVHALAHRMNDALGNVGEGKPVRFTEPVEAFAAGGEGGPQTPVQSLRQLMKDMTTGAADTLLILGGNPAFTAPADLAFGDALLDFSKSPGPEVNGRETYRNFSAHLDLYYDETSYVCQWHVPESHYLEAWSDGRAYDGTATIMQPLIAPLYSSRSAHEVVAALDAALGAAAGSSNQDGGGGAEQADAADARPVPAESADVGESGYSIVRAFWRRRHPDNFETFWESALNRGVVPDSAAATVDVSPVAVGGGDGAAATAPATAPSGLEITFRPDPGIYDGRFYNNGWLQELPKPLLKITWDNAVLMSPATARDFGVSPGEGPVTGTRKAVKLTLTHNGRPLHIDRAAVWVMPGHPDAAVTVYLGYGRAHAVRIGELPPAPHGFNAYALRTSDAMGFAHGLQLSEAGGNVDLACTQNEQLIHEERDLVRHYPVGHSPVSEGSAHEPTHGLDPDPGGTVGGHISLFPEYDYRTAYEGQHRWGMVVDLNACIGCNACVVACQAENNSPVVGKDQVYKGRAMHWLRIDTYYEYVPPRGGGSPGAREDPNRFFAYFQPMMCHHCENAPCEVVCPVAATTHSVEGLNEMTYNRCVGTRYCSNNCPYKVRRFNFFQYHDKTTPVLKLMRNPDVTVRDRGVMEKCTYCVQRLNETRIEVKRARVQAATAAGDAEQAKERAAARIDELMGDLRTACQQACPTEAIVFGDMNYRFGGAGGGKPTRVTWLKGQPHEYKLLDELNTQPRTSYLAWLRNPNPEFEAFAPVPPGTEMETAAHERARA